MSKGGNQIIPMSLQLQQYRKVHKSKEEIRQRLEYEEKMKVGKRVFIITDKILKYPHAIAKWNQLVTIYENFEFVSEIDIGIMEKYCICHAEYYYLLEIKNELLKQYDDKIVAYRMVRSLKIEQDINNKVEILLKLEDRLFLNPHSRLKNIPKFESEDKKESYLEILGFGNV